MGSNHDVGGAIQEQLRAVIARGRSDQQALIASLSADERAAVGKPDHWSPKDHVAHMNFWRQRALNHMAAAERGQEVPEYPEDDVQRLNAQTFAAQRLTPWDAQVAESERLFNAAAGLIDRLEPSQLTAGQLSPAREGRPLMEDVLNGFFLHPSEHLAQLYRERGDAERADREWVAGADAIGEIFGPSKVYGNALYNLGCYWATSGRPERAVDALRQAFPLNPALVAFSRQDPDLDTLRDIPAFQALTAL